VARGVLKHGMRRRNAGRKRADMITIKNVLVATDFSPAAETALLYGRALAGTFNGTLHVMHVVDNLNARFAYGDAAVVGMGETQAELEAASQRQLDDLIDECDRRELHAVPVVKVSSNTTNAIADYARESGIDLIVVGATGRGAIDRMLLGSVADKLIRRSPCPVLAVHRPEREFVVPDALQVVASVKV